MRLYEDEIAKNMRLIMNFEFPGHDNVTYAALIRFKERGACRYQYLIIAIAPIFSLNFDEIVRVYGAETISAQKCFRPGSYNMCSCHVCHLHEHLKLPNTHAVLGQMTALPTEDSQVDYADKRRCPQQCEVAAEWLRQKHEFNLS